MSRSTQTGSQCPPDAAATVRNNSWYPGDYDAASSDPQLASPASPEYPLSTPPGSSRSRRAAFGRHFSVSAFSGRSKSPAPPPHASSIAGKGPLGLTTVYRPDDSTYADSHIVLVHGLGGGSQHTWTKDAIFWPRDLLPQQESLQNATIHTFGYDSDFKKSSTLNINDFSKSLLNNMVNNPDIRGSDVRKLQYLSPCCLAQLRLY